MDQELEQLRDIALAHAKKILAEMGVDQNDAQYPTKQYQMQYEIYHAMKKVFEIEVKY